MISSNKLLPPLMWYAQFLSKNTTPPHVIQESWPSLLVHCLSCGSHRKERGEHYQLHWWGPGYRGGFIYHTSFVIRPNSRWPPPVKFPQIREKQLQCGSVRQECDTRRTSWGKLGMDRQNQVYCKQDNTLPLMLGRVWLEKMPSYPHRPTEHSEALQLTVFWLARHKEDSEEDNNWLSYF